MATFTNAFAALADSDDERPQVKKVKAPKAEAAAPAPAAAAPKAAAPKAAATGDRKERDHAPRKPREARSPRPAEGEATGEAAVPRAPRRDRDYDNYKRKQAGERLPNKEEGHHVSGTGKTGHARRGGKSDEGYKGNRAARGPPAKVEDEVTEGKEEVAAPAAEGEAAATETPAVEEAAPVAPVPVQLGLQDYEAERKAKRADINAAFGSRTARTVDASAFSGLKPKTKEILDDKPTAAAKAAATQKKEKAQRALETQKLDRSALGFRVVQLGSTDQEREPRPERSERTFRPRESREGGDRPRAPRSPRTTPAPATTA